MGQTHWKQHVVGQSNLFGGWQILIATFIFTLVLNVFMFLVFSFSEVPSHSAIYWIMCAVLSLSSFLFSLRVYRRTDIIANLSTLVLMLVVFVVLKHYIANLISEDWLSAIGKSGLTFTVLDNLSTILAMAIGFFAGFACGLLWFGRIRVQDGYTCPKCGYNLLGLNGDRCPECGWRVDFAELGTTASDFARGQRLWLGKRESVQ